MERGPASAPASGDEEPTSMASMAEVEEVEVNWCGPPNDAITITSAPSRLEFSLLFSIYYDEEDGESFSFIFTII